MKFMIDLIHPSCFMNLASWKKVGSWVLHGGDISKKLNSIHKERYGFFKSASHPTAKEMRRYFSYEWSNFYKFCFVRNPYEKAVSDYVWMTKSKNANVSFADFLRRIDDRELDDPEDVIPIPPINWPLYTIDDRVEVDYIGRYENLMEDLEIVFKEIGIPFDSSRFPMAKKVKDYDYRRYYGSTEKKLVENIYRNEIDMFDYEFNEY